MRIHADPDPSPKHCKKQNLNLFYKLRADMNIKLSEAKSTYPIRLSMYSMKINNDDQFVDIVTQNFNGHSV